MSHLLFSENGWWNDPEDHNQWNEEENETLVVQINNPQLTEQFKNPCLPTIDLSRRGSNSSLWCIAKHFYYAWSSPGAPGVVHSWNGVCLGGKGEPTLGGMLLVIDPPIEALPTRVRAWTSKDDDFREWNDFFVPFVSDSDGCLEGLLWPVAVGAKRSGGSSPTKSSWCSSPSSLSPSEGSSSSVCFCSRLDPQMPAHIPITEQYTNNIRDHA